MSRFIVAVLLSIVTLLFPASLVAAQSMADIEKGSDSPSILAVLSAEGGSFTPDSDGFGTLRLEGVDHAVWFTDRPTEEAGIYGIEDLVADFFTDLEPPNAALNVLAADASQDVVILTLSSLEYEPATAELTFEARVIDPTVTADEDEAAIVAFAERADPRISATFGPAGLFIDSAKRKTIHKLAGLDPSDLKQCGLDRPGHGVWVVSSSGSTCDFAHKFMLIPRLQDHSVCAATKDDAMSTWTDTAYGQVTCFYYPRWLLAPPHTPQASWWYVSRDHGVWAQPIDCPAAGCPDIPRAS